MSTNMRAAGILVFCLFSILSTVTSLKCETCVALRDECEKEAVKVVECKEDEEFCSTLVFNNSFTKSPVSLIVKECTKRDYCFNGPLSTTTVDGRFEVAKAHCCQSDVCNIEPLQLEHYDEFQPNGLQCPGCYALDEDSCEANQTVICVGKEDQCITISSTTVAFGNYTEKVTYQGCTTKTLCSYPLGESQLGQGAFQFNVTILECRNASSSNPDLQ